MWVNTCFYQYRFCYLTQSIRARYKPYLLLYLIYIFGHYISYILFYAEDATYSGAIYYGNTEHRLNAEVFFMIHHNEGGEEVGRSLFTVATEGCIPLETTSYHYTDSSKSIIDLRHAQIDIKFTPNQPLITVIKNR